MASSSPDNNPFPWQPPPYATYGDCSLAICTIYCPQWCMFFPPPPDSSGSGTYFSPLVISVIVILGTAFLLVTYFTIFKKSCGRRRLPGRDPPSGDHVDSVFLRAGSPVGLDESAIKSIAVYKYKKGEGLVDGTDCSVCLSEFQDDESLRLLPKCNHAFHLPCIDAWLKSHSNCPLCRANASPSVNSSPPYELPLTVLSSPSPTNHDDTIPTATTVSTNSNTSVSNEVVITVMTDDVSPSSETESSGGQDHVPIADVLSEGHEEEVEGRRTEPKAIGPSKSFRCSDDSTYKSINNIPELRRAVSTGGSVHRK
ncbi:hypothetical protein MLD38_010173 [Melastoma candidum]|uniref:Uncharacterized protein n=1 Tax=Melastoma candidum TaxID=119954 RepID=A0ACB9QZ22_9MYRT|nr:hypothetical protein MLD38_010173 [Melastoma candidum]